MQGGSLPPLVKSQRRPAVQKRYYPVSLSLQKHFLATLVALHFTPVSK